MRLTALELQLAPNKSHLLTIKKNTNISKNTFTFFTSHLRFQNCGFDFTARKRALILLPVTRREVNFLEHDKRWLKIWVFWKVVGWLGRAVKLSGGFDSADTNREPHQVHRGWQSELRLVRAARHCELARCGCPALLFSHSRKFPHQHQPCILY